MAKKGLGSPILYQICSVLYNIRKHLLEPSTARTVLLNIINYAP